MSGPSDKAPEASDTAPAASDTGSEQVGPDEAMAAILAARAAWEGAKIIGAMRDVKELFDAGELMASVLDRLIAAEPVSRAMGGIVRAAVMRDAAGGEWSLITEVKGTGHSDYDVAANAFDAADAALDDAVDAYLEAAGLAESVADYLDAVKASRIQSGLMTANEIRSLEGLAPLPAPAATQEQAVEILPCPFCGKPVFEKRRKNNPYAKCVTEGCFGARLQVVSLDDPQQVSEWNTRPTAPSTAGDQGVLRDALSLISDGPWARPHSIRAAIAWASGIAKEALATPPAQAAPTLADRLLAAGVDLERDKHELLALLRPDAVWQADAQEWSTDTLAEAMADANWMEPVAIQRGYAGAKVWAVRIPIGDSEGMVEDEEFRVFATEEAAKDYCRGAEEAQP
ncbi:Lar family restriction alleviation protein [Roseomonas mucosa]|uniref:Lar family restriction alleviation protein n=1 Tax=Roseomonas mucosa TaxID=207340 RepID=UPI001EF62B74|nr:Lar family restriction alleviation protein [Roseomonas mucosa]MCG7357123.1 Lar family restriction alleviation protein [Roseomonas mucosa]